jgi:hypothetical protein
MNIDVAVNNVVLLLVAQSPHRASQVYEFRLIIQEIEGARPTRIGESPLNGANSRRCISLW